MVNSPSGCKRLWGPPRGAREVKQPGWAVFYSASPAAATRNSRAVPHRISCAFCFTANKAKLRCELGELRPARKLMDLRGVNLHQIKCWNRSLKLSDCCAGCWLSSCSLHDLSPALRCFLSFPLGAPTQGRFVARTSVPCMSMASGAAGAGHRQQGWVQVGKIRGK